ncbi:YceI family protein [Streptomyces alboniger]|uniref:Polyisoprenoid-binding protein n=1 Tax=Streptomyces alboniger TaxID=132473 RepID=A0A5J6HJG2_STRAD|nr:YceI family protein [Streptomyces alboniger]QEV19382.1 polyisoprenoid-binding protein [Streptomyces alboniger]
MTPTTRLDELTGDYVIDIAHTRIGFVARHTMATRVRGQFDEFGGTVHLDGGHPSRSGVRLAIRAQSIQTGSKQRDDLLRGKFLDVENHPDITFSSVGVARTDDTHFTVTGDLTLRGVTQPVSAGVELLVGTTGPRGDFRVGFRGGVTVDRGDWGVNWNAVTRALISPEVTLEFDITALRNP